jgi:16S rRNA processing protein RimM
MANADNWVELAAIVHAHGLRGEVKVKSFTDPAAGFADYPDLQLTDGTPIKLRITGTLRDQFIIRIDGVTNRTQAETWRGKTIGIIGEKLPELVSDTEFYHRELVGMKVVDATGTPCGTVKQVANYGASDLLEIGYQGKSEFYAFTNANFPRIDRAARVIEFHPPEVLVVRRQASGVSEESASHSVVPSPSRGRLGRGALNEDSVEAPPSNLPPQGGEASPVAASHVRDRDDA